MFRKLHGQLPHIKYYDSTRTPTQNIGPVIVRNRFKSLGCAVGLVLCSVRALVVSPKRENTMRDDETTMRERENTMRVRENTMRGR